VKLRKRDNTSKIILIKLHIKSNSQ